MEPLITVAYIKLTRFWFNKLVIWIWCNLHVHEGLSNKRQTDLFRPQRCTTQGALVIQTLGAFLLCTDFLSIVHQCFMSIRFKLSLYKNYSSSAILCSQPYGVFIPAFSFVPCHFLPIAFRSIFIRCSCFQKIYFLKFCISLRIYSRGFPHVHH